MIPEGASQNRITNTSGFLYSMSNKSKPKLSPSPKKGFLLNLADDDPPNDSSQKPESNLEKLKSLFDIDSNEDLNENKDSPVPLDSSLELASTNTLKKSNNKDNYNDPLALNLLSNPNSQNSPKDQQIEDLKKQMKYQQQQIQFLLQQQRTSNFQFINPLPLSNNVNNIECIESISNNNDFFNDPKSQEGQIQDQVFENNIHSDLNLNNTEIKPHHNSKVTSFDFSRGDTPSFIVKYNFGTGKEFISRTKPSKQFLMCNFNNFFFSKSKTDNSNKKGGFEYTDSFINKAQRETNKSGQNEKNILRIQGIKLYVLSSDDKNIKKFSLIGQGQILITLINEIYRIIVRSNNLGKCILNTRVFPSFSPIINNKSIQIIGQNSGSNNEDNNTVNNFHDKEDNNDSDDNKNETEKESILSIYRICFPTQEKAKEFFQCLNLIK